MDVFLNSNGSIADINFRVVNMGGDYTSYDGGMTDSMTGETTDASSSPAIMSNWFFVIGVSVATLAISVVLGILLAKKRIKKGFDLYED